MDEGMGINDDEAEEALAANHWRRAWRAIVSGSLAISAASASRFFCRRLELGVVENERLREWSKGIGAKEASKGVVGEGTA